ncbi:MAG: hypothetical protein A3E84_04280 [Gammaproteobacteria bacterium RIFCSPHIGHO2_12_FULL_42_13]|nr:MAG: hypothetical protein A3E84_04280 [Gammaproteobacteria bacterium RIFCSPHIGHO2_12_FULL_42_13]
MLTKWLAVLAIICVMLSPAALAFTRGIYINGSTMQDTKKLTWLIQESKKYNIDTFVIDMERTPSKLFQENIQKVLDANIRYVARVVIFTGGGTHAQVNDQTILGKKLALAKYAVALGAQAIQLDYIRYRSENPADPNKAINIANVVDFFRSELKSVELQVDIFGIATHKPANTIGQNVEVLAEHVDTFCPMVYPSHYEPYLVHAKQPYETIYKSMIDIRKQLVNYPKKQVIAYIELYNYRYPLSYPNRLQYILAEMKGAEAGGANGWYVWSPNNHYQPLFDVLGARTSAGEMKNFSSFSPQFPFATLPSNFVCC